MCDLYETVLETILGEQKADSFSPNQFHTEHNFERDQLMQQ